MGAPVCSRPPRPPRPGGEGSGVQVAEVSPVSGHVQEAVLVSTSAHAPVPLTWSVARVTPANSESRSVEWNAHASFCS
jgi:hypothetical protein